MARRPCGGLIPARAGKTVRRRARSVRAPAHPRACGENSVSPISNAPARGSSPRVRGKPDSHGMGGVHGRLIPARAGKTVEAVRAYYNPRAHPRACGKTASTARTRACSPAHPRACGENSPGRASLVTTPGSSPRVRGKPTRSRPQGLPRGLIPARAGKTLKRLVTQSHAPAHPRACGENGRDFGDPLVRRGSSPRVRGKLVDQFAVAARDGLIPARAGKTSPTSRRRPRPTAHPRACGENPNRSRASARIPGSSPRVRGKPGKPLRSSPGPRLIPARAGKTNTTAFPLEWDRAHPRACGENRTAGKSLSNRAGSSPRVRGKLGGIPLTCYRIGLIPARAGKTGSFVAVSITPKAHPRACGENPRRTVTLSAIRGSSPRVRGKHKDRKTGKPTIGLIPARAGKTGVTCWRHPLPGAHPRACGENATSGRFFQRQPGSSPRVRGKPGINAKIQDSERLIPARAGKTREAAALIAGPPAHPRACGENISRILDVI